MALNETDRARFLERFGHLPPTERKRTPEQATATAKALKYKVRKRRNNFVAWSDELPACRQHGATREEARGKAMQRAAHWLQWTDPFPKMSAAERQATQETVSQHVDRFTEKSGAKIQEGMC